MDIHEQQDLETQRFEDCLLSVSRSFIAVRGNDLPFGGKSCVRDKSRKTKNEGAVLFAALTGVESDIACPRLSLPSCGRMRCRYEHEVSIDYAKSVGASTDRSNNESKKKPSKKVAISGPHSFYRTLLDKSVDTEELEGLIFTTPTEADIAYSDNEDEPADTYGEAKDGFLTPDQYTARVKESMSRIGMRAQMLQELSLGEIDFDGRIDLKADNKHSSLSKSSYGYLKERSQIGTPYMNKTSAVVKHARMLAGRVHVDERAIDLRNVFSRLQWIADVAVRDTQHIEAGADAPQSEIIKERLEEIENSQWKLATAPPIALQLASDDVQDRLANLFQEKNHLLKMKEAKVKDIESEGQEGFLQKMDALETEYELLGSTIAQSLYQAERLEKLYQSLEQSINKSGTGAGKQIQQLAQTAELESTLTNEVVEQVVEREVVVRQPEVVIEPPPPRPSPPPPLPPPTPPPPKLDKPKDKPKENIAVESKPEHIKKEKEVKKKKKKKEEKETTSAIETGVDVEPIGPSLIDLEEKARQIAPPKEEVPLRKSMAASKKSVKVSEGDEPRSQPPMKYQSKVYPKKMSKRLSRASKTIRAHDANNKLEEEKRASLSQNTEKDDASDLAGAKPLAHDRPTVLHSATIDKDKDKDRDKDTDKNKDKDKDKETKHPKMPEFHVSEDEVEEPVKKMKKQFRDRAMQTDDITILSLVKKEHDIAAIDDEKQHPFLPPVQEDQEGNLSARSNEEHIELLQTELTKSQQQLQFYRARNWAEKHAAHPVPTPVNPEVGKRSPTLPSDPDVGLIYFYNPKSGLRAVISSEDLREKKGHLARGSTVVQNRQKDGSVSLDIVGSGEKQRPRSSTR